MPLIVATRKPLVVGTVMQPGTNGYCGFIDGHGNRQEAQPLVILREATAQEYLEAALADGVDISLGAAENAATPGVHFYEIFTD